MKHVTRVLLVVLLGIYLFGGIYISREMNGDKRYDVLESKVVRKEKTLDKETDKYNYFLVFNIDFEEVRLSCTQTTFIRMKKGRLVTLRKTIYTNGNGKETYSYTFID